VFAKVNDGRVEHIVEVARQVENTEEDFLADTSFSRTPQEIHVPTVLSVPSRSITRFSRCCATATSGCSASG